VRSLVHSNLSRPIDCRDPGKRRENLSYSLGDMGFVPRRDAVLLTNFDKMQQQVYPARERETIRRTAKKSVAVQTPGLARVRHVHSSSSQDTEIFSLSLGFIWLRRVDQSFGSLRCGSERGDSRTICSSIVWSSTSSPCDSDSEESRCAISFLKRVEQIKRPQRMTKA
jgi:hypothetical protein